MRTRGLLLALATIFALSFSSCVKDDIDSKTERYHYSEAEYAVLTKDLNLPELPMDYKVKFPFHFSMEGANQPFISNPQATLGRVLFYDKDLSLNSKVSCASCHDQSRAFADPVALSEGFEGKKTKRNSFALGAVANFEASYNSNSFTGGPFGSRVGNIFWDNRASSIQEQSTLTLQDPIEMGMNMQLLEERVAAKDYYKILFKKAYGTEHISSHLILEAIAEFINSMVTAESKFDVGLESHSFEPEVNFGNFSAQENLGKQLYMDKCSGCHGKRLVAVEEEMASNGLDEVYTDKGIGDVTNDPSLNGVFKVPLLRNIALTGPYMHDGRFETLEDVIDHYSTGIKPHANLHFRLRAGSSPRQFDFTAEEKAALVAFMKTLTDPNFLTAERFSDPFKQ